MLINVEELIEQLILVVLQQLGELQTEAEVSVRHILEGYADVILGLILAKELGVISDLEFEQKIQIELTTIKAELLQLDILAAESIHNAMHNLVDLLATVIKRA